MRKFVSATVSAALCLASLVPGIAAAQEYRFTGLDAPQGATATLNLRVPLGPESRSRPSAGLTLGYGQQTGAYLDGRPVTRAFNFADFRFNESGLSRASVASFDLANLDRDRRMNLTGGGKKTWLLIGGIIVAGVVICLAADCFDDDDDDDSTSTPGN